MKWICLIELELELPFHLLIPSLLAYHFDRVDGDLIVWQIDRLVACLRDRNQLRLSS